MLEAGVVSLNGVLALPRNAKRHDVPAVLRSMQEFSFLERIVINRETGHLISGHGRIEALVEQRAAGGRPPGNVMEQDGDWFVPADYCRIPAEKEEAAAIALNRTVALGGMDDAVLAEILSDVAAQSEELLQASGYDQDDLDALIKDVGSPAIGTSFQVDLDEIPPDVATRCKAGELWMLGEHRLLCDDSTKPENVVRVMGGGRVARVMITDPPYGVDYVDKARDMNRRGYRHSNATRSVAIQGDEIDEAQAENLLRPFLMAAMEHALGEHAAVYIWHAPGRAILSLHNLLAELCFLHHQTIVWVKPHFVIGRCDYQWMHELCYYGWRRGSRPPFYGEKNQTTVWDVARDTEHREHPTQKPVELFARPMRNHCVAGDVVYDPFAGSGTALIAAEAVGVCARVIEIMPRFCDVILARWEAVTGREARQS